MGPAVNTRSSEINLSSKVLTERFPLKKSIHTLVSTRLPELFTVFHPFQFQFFELLPIQIDVDLSAEREEFSFPLLADVFFDGQTNRFGLFLLPGDLKKVLNESIGEA